MPSIYELQNRRTVLIERINRNFDFLMGSISTKGLKSPAYNLTMKVDGKTRTRHIPIERLSAVRRLTQRHQTVKRLLKQLADLNWKVLLEGGG
jgi:hypothetical protein